MSKKQESKQFDVQVPVTFRGISIGDHTCRLGLSIQRKTIPLGTIDKTFCDARVDVILRIDGKAAEAGAQQPLTGFLAELAAVADIKRIGFGTDEYSLGLTFAKKSVDVACLSQFANATGTLSATRTGDAAGFDEAEKESHDPDQMNLEDAAQAGDDDPQLKPVAEMTKDAALVEACKSLGINHLGDWNAALAEKGGLKAMRKNLLAIEGVTDDAITALFNRAKLEMEREPAAKRTPTGYEAALAALPDEPKRKLLRAVTDAGRSLTKVELAEILGIHPNGGRFGTDLGWLRTMGLLPPRGDIAMTRGLML